MAKISKNSLGSGFGEPRATDPPDPGDVDYVCKMAHYLINNDIDDNPTGDALIGRCIDFYKARRSAKAKDLLALQMQYPELYRIHRMRENPQDVRAQIVEAAILADADRQEIAEYTGLSAAEVDMYEKIFFNADKIRGSLGYVLGKISPGIAAINMPFQEHKDIWKAVALAKGWRGLKAYLNPDNYSADIMSFVYHLGVKREGKKMAASAHLEAISPTTAWGPMNRYTVGAALAQMASSSQAQGEEMKELRSVLQELSGGFRPASWDGNREFPQNETRYLDEAVELDERILGDQNESSE